MRKTTIGTSRADYNAARNFMSLPFEQYEFKRVRDLFSSARSLHRKFTKVGDPLWLRYTFFDFNLSRVSMFHFFNTVSFSRRPWVVTFEANVPRWHSPSGQPARLGLQVLSRPNCKRLIAISQWAYETQCRHLAVYPQFEPKIRTKMCVRHPPQRLCLQNYAEKIMSAGPVTFAFIGHEFFRKGGREVLLAFERLFAEKAPIRLIIVSRLATDNWATASTERDVQWAKATMARYPGRIIYHPSLSNPQVLELLKSCHVGLLPSYEDSYGYSVLEAQACGCPVISSNVRALPEINNNEVGWLVALPKDRYGKATVSTPEERCKVSEVLQEALYETIRSIIHSPDVIRMKGERALRRIKEHHDPHEYAAFLSQLYDSIVRGEC